MHFYHYFKKVSDSWEYILLTSDDVLLLYK